jgi:hypothetical protein
MNLDAIELSDEVISIQYSFEKTLEIVSNKQEKNCCRV